MFDVFLDNYRLLVHDGPLPDMYNEYRKHAALAEEFDIGNAGGEGCFVAVAKTGGWPSLTVAQRYDPSGGFTPGLLLVAETRILFIGAGTRLLAYSLERWERLWQDTTYLGFWSWQRYKDYILMSGELELAVWNTSGKKLWTTMVEPPWTFAVQGDWIHLDVMGKVYDFELGVGPTGSTMG